MVSRNGDINQQFEELLTSLDTFTPPKSSEDANPDVPFLQAERTNTIDIINQYGLLPETLGEGSSNPALADVKSIFDAGLYDYLESLSYDEQDAFYQAFNPSPVVVPDPNYIDGQSGGLFGLVQDVAGEGLGIIGKGLEVLDIPSQYTEQALGFLYSYYYTGFGNDLSIGERWDAGRLLYEGIGKGGVFGGDEYGPIYDAWKLAATDDTSFEKFIEENQGGVVNTAFRIVADPLWLLGGVPIVPGVIKMTRIAKLERTADFLSTGIQLSKVRGLGELLTRANSADNIFGGVFRKTVGPALTLLGTPIERRIAGRTIREISLAGDLSRRLFNEQEIQVALGRIGNPGFLKSLTNLRPDRAAETAAENVYRLVESALRYYDDPNDIRKLLQEWKNGIGLPGAVANKRVGNLFPVLNKLEIDNFTAFSDDFIKGIGGDVAAFRSKLLDEVAHGAGEIPANERQSLLDIANLVHGVDTPGAVSRLSNSWRRVLGFVLLNNPGYAVLNFVNNTFTVGFDAIDSFNRDPYGTLGVIGSQFGLFSERHSNYMTRVFGDNWKEIKESAASVEWSRREIAGLGKSGKPTKWTDNRALNAFTVAASYFDKRARGTAAEFAMLRADHFLNRFGASGVVDVPERFQSIIGENVKPTELVEDIQRIRDGEAFGKFSLRKVENELWAEYGDDATRTLARETLYTHLGGQRMAVEDSVLDAVRRGDLGEASRVIDQAKADMKLWHQRSQRISNLGPNSTGVKMESVFDAPVRDWALHTDEFHMWNTQLDQLVQASGSVIPMRRGLYMSQLDQAFKKFTETRQVVMRDLIDNIARNGVDVASEGKRLVDEIDSITKTYKEEAKVVLDKLVNEMARVDINQARIFNETGQRFLSSLGSPEDAYRSALRSTYWPRRVEETQAFDLLESANDARATSVRDIFGDSVSRVRVGSFPRPPVLSELPQMSDRFGVYEDVFNRWGNHIKGNLNRIVSDADNLRSTTELDDLAQWIDGEVRNRLIDIDFAKQRFVNHMTNFSMLDYGHQYGAEKYVQWLFPYEFWPTRTFWHWAERIAAKPGAVHSAWQLYEFQQEWQGEVNDKYVKQIQDRLDNEDLTPEIRAQLEKELADAEVLAARMQKLVIPVPGLNSILNRAGLSGIYNPEIAIEPLSALFPIASWAKDYADYNAEPTNIFGKLYRDAESVGLSVNPLAKTVASLSGAIPERDEAFDWARRTGSPALVAFGVGPAGQALYRWLSLGDDSAVAKLEEATGVEIRNFFFENGYGPQGLLQYLAAEITGTDPRDRKNFELYGTSRVLASLAAEDERLIKLEKERRDRKAKGESSDVVDEDINFKREAVAQEYIRAYFDQSGEVWDRARKVYASEQGLKELTSWLFGMGGINIWQPGEVIQNGLEFLYDATLKQGNAEERGQFYDRYPEFTPRRIQDVTLSNQEAAWDISRESVWYWESELIQKKYSRRIEEINTQIEDLSEKISGVESLGLNLRVNRESRSALSKQRGELYDERAQLYDQRNEDYDRIDALFGKHSNSTGKNPWERALDDAAEEWYASYRIEDDELRKRTQDAFLEKFPPATTSNSYLSWITLGIQASAIREESRIAGFDKSNEQRRELREEADRQIIGLTSQASRFITRRDIEEHIGLKKQGPISAELSQYLTALTLMQQYRAIGEISGLSDEQKRERKKEFWDSNPLLEKYYGLESYLGHPDYAIQATLQAYYEIFENAPAEGSPGRREYFQANGNKIDQMRALLEENGLIDPQSPEEVRWGQFWDTYYSLPKEQRSDYYKENQSEVEKLREILGKKPAAVDADVARESQIWNHYYSLDPGVPRRAYLLLVADELNEIRRRLGKPPLTNIGYTNDRPRMSDSAPVEQSDLNKVFSGSLSGG